jgi:hypothetical protein
MTTALAADLLVMNKWWIVGAAVVGSLALWIAFPTRVTLLVMVAALVALVGTPAFVIARRRGMKNPWVAFIPLFGVWIVLCESMGRSGWLALLALVPMFGGLILILWTAIEIPAHHGRSGAWTLALIVPIVNIVGYWVYAFTLKRDDPALAY